MRVTTPRRRKQAGAWKTRYSRSKVVDVFERSTESLCFSRIECSQATKVRDNKKTSGLVSPMDTYRPRSAATLP